MNIYDVSEKAGVSIATVSRVLNGNPNVSDRTRKKVLDVIEELDYTPNVFARGLGLNTMNIIGIMCPDSSDIYLANIVYYVEQGLRSNGYDSLLCCTGYTLKAKQNYMQLMLSRRVDAIILIGSSSLDVKDSNNDYIREAAKSVPVIIVNAILEGENIYCIKADERVSICSAVSRALESGRKRPLYLYTGESLSGIQKIAGFQDACAAYQAEATMQSFHRKSNPIGSSREYLQETYHGKMPYDVIFTSEDGLAVGALKYCLQNGISVPEEVAIVGYNNTMLSYSCEPELTTMNPKPQKLSSIAVKILMDSLSGKKDIKNVIRVASFHPRQTTDF